MPNSIRGGAEGHPPTHVWSFDLGGGVVPWVGAAPPDVRTLRRVRGIRSRSGASHVPTWAYSSTVEAHLQLESGLEHDLLRDLDRDPAVSWLVSQPARLSVHRGGRKNPGSVPDLLSVSTDGDVTVWAVRPEARQDERFEEQVELTAAACVDFGWALQVFSGMSVTRRANLMWLDGYRRAMPWYRDALSMVRATHGTGVTFADVLEMDARNGHVVSAIWHALRNGNLDCDLDAPFTESTQLQFPDEVAT